MNSAVGGIRRICKNFVRWDKSYYIFPPENLECGVKCTVDNSLFEGVAFTVGGISWFGQYERNVIYRGHPLDIYLITALWGVYIALACGAVSISIPIILFTGSSHLLQFLNWKDPES